MADDLHDDLMGSSGIPDDDLFSNGGPGLAGPVEQAGPGPVIMSAGYISHNGSLKIGDFSPKRISAFQWVIAFLVITACGLVGYVVLFMVRPTQTHVGPSRGAAVSDNNLVEPTHWKPNQQLDKGRYTSSSPLPLSRSLAEEHYHSMDFERASRIYQALLEQHVPTAANEAARDFLMYRLALCAKAQAQTDKAYSLLTATAKSRYPVIRAISRYQLGLAADLQKRYLDAANEFYQALALSDAISGLGSWPDTFRRNCHYMIAKVMTMEAITSREDLAGVPAAMHMVSVLPDPWGQIDDDNWQVAIRSGAAIFNEAVIGPIVEPSTNSVGGWLVVANGAPLEQVLKRFTAKTGLDVAWTWQSATGTLMVDPSVRKRPVYVYIDGAGPQQALATVVASAGLYVQKQAQGAVCIMDPYNYHSLGEHIAWLRQQAITAWNQFRANWDQPELKGRSHIAVGLLYEHDGRPLEAIAEYGLLLRIPGQIELAPYALWRSSLLRAQHGDLLGAMGDLAQLTEQYPQSIQASMALCSLAELTMRSGRYDDASRIAIKVYHSEHSQQRQRWAAFIAGRCLYITGQYQQAIRWLSRYMELGPDVQDPNRSEVLTYLGRSYRAIGQLDMAAASLEGALLATRDPAAYMDVLEGLVQVYMDNSEFVRAMAVLSGEHPVGLSGKDRSRVAFMKARVLGAMGLVEQATEGLEELYRQAADPNQRQAICRELGRFYVILGQWDKASRSLSEALMIGNPGPAAHQIRVELAYVMLNLGRLDQAIGLCRQALDLDMPADLHKKARDILYASYVKKGQYDQAANALIIAGRQQ